jgi:hypothetical protein
MTNHIVRTNFAHISCTYAKQYLISAMKLRNYVIFLLQIPTNPNASHRRPTIKQALETTN